MSKFARQRTETAWALRSGWKVGIWLVMALMFCFFSTAFAQEIDWTRQFGSDDWDSAYGVALDGEGSV